MASNVKLNLGAFRAFRQSSNVLGAINAEADRIAARANGNVPGECGHPEHARFTAEHAIPTQAGAVALVTTGGDAGAIAHNAKHNTLIRAMGGG